LVKLSAFSILNNGFLINFCKYFESKIVFTDFKDKIQYFVEITTEGSLLSLAPKKIQDRFGCQCFKLITDVNVNFSMLVSMFNGGLQTLCEHNAMSVRKYLKQGYMDMFS